MAAGADVSCDLRIDTQRLLRRLAALGEVGADGGGASRLALTPADKAGRDLVVGWMREAGLEIHVDPIGNVIGLWSAGPDAEVVLTGSHIDTVTQGGRYDGNLGVLGGLEAIEALRESGLQPRRSLGVAFFTNEEGVRFAPDMMGSLVFAGGLPLAEALDTRSSDGARLGDELAAIGYAGERFFPHDKISAYLELHIEQGPVLESLGIDIGVVLGVQGIRWMEVEFRGEARHAGTTPMALRRDAGAAAFDFAAETGRLPEQIGGAQLATIGRVVLEPNLVNVVARRALVTVDVRNTDAASLRQAADQVVATARRIAEARGVDVAVRDLVDLAPVSFDPAVVDAVRAGAQALGLSTVDLPSGAGHDAQMLARVCPSGMIFVPSVGGVSHNPREFTEPRDLQAGTNVLAQVLAQLAT